MKSFLAILLACVCLAGPVRAGEVDVSALVDRNAIESGQPLTLTVSIRGGEGEVNLSGIRDFDVISRSTSRQYSIVNGQTETSVYYTYRLMPRHEGRLLIPPLPVTVDGKTHYTDLIEIMAGRPNGNNEAADAPPDLFAEISVSDDQPYAGQQIVGRVTFYKAGEVRAANAELTRIPDFEGFSAEQVKESRNFTRTINGRRYQATEVVYILTPEKAGEFTVGPAEISCDVLVRGERRGRSPFDDFFDDSFFGGSRQLEPRRVTAESVTVTVRPLPPYAGPGRFSGLVGTFDISVQIDRTVLAAGESATLQVTVSGQGNISEAAIRDLDIPAAFKVYSDSPEADIAVSEAGVSGKKRFDRALVALDPGDYSLGPFSLTYFDVDREAYVTTVAEPLDVMVKPAPAGSQEAAAAGPGETRPSPEKETPEKSTVELTGRDIFPLKADLDALIPQHRLPWWQFSLLVAAPAILYVLAAFALVRLRREATEGDVMARRARTAVKEAASQEIQGHEFLATLYRAMVYAVYARAGRKGESLTDGETSRILAETGCDAQLAAEVRTLIAEIEQRRYGGEAIDPDRARELLASVRRITGRLLS